jgi:hypothetical protein
MAVAGGVSVGSSPSPLLRQGVPGERKPLKEKLLTYYEMIFEVNLTILNACWNVVCSICREMILHDRNPSSGMNSSS